MIQPIQSGAISVRDVAIHFGSGNGRVEAVTGFNLDIRGGEFVALLGPSGCGKSSLLNAIAGFHAATQGEILLDGKAVKAPGADRGMVFQHHSLFPWKTVKENVAFGPKMRGIPRKERDAETLDFLKQVGLSGFERHYPAQLSGGMQQRVGIARVLINRPKVMLMDEPFGALDAQTRLLMQELLLDVWEKFRTTVVFVTHDIDEALLLSDRIVVITSRPGKIKEIIPVPFDRPRRSALVTSPEFAALKRSCLELVREESLKAMGVDTSAFRFQDKAASAAS
jgi:NitT/TauT family transport system ATP-binding protein